MVQKVIIGYTDFSTIDLREYLSNVAEVIQEDDNTFICNAKTLRECRQDREPCGKCCKIKLTLTAEVLERYCY